MLILYILCCTKYLRHIKGLLNINIKYTQTKKKKLFILFLEIFIQQQKDLVNFLNIPAYIKDKCNNGIYITNLVFYIIYR